MRQHRLSVVTTRKPRLDLSQVKLSLVITHVNDLKPFLKPYSLIRYRKLSLAKTVFCQIATWYNTAKGSTSYCYCPCSGVTSCLIELTLPSLSEDLLSVISTATPSGRARFFDWLPSEHQFVILPMFLALLQPVHRRILMMLSSDLRTGEVEVMVHHFQS